MSVDDMITSLSSIFYNRGFKTVTHSENFGCIDFSNIQEKSEHWVRISYDISTFKFITIHGEITFPSVVSILDKFRRNNCHFIKEIHKEEIVTNYFINSQWSKEMTSLRKLSINDSINKNLFYNHIMCHHDNYILPFFERFPDLKSVNDEIINKVSSDDYTHYIPGETNFKVLIIMKLCNNAKYEDFKKWALGAYKYGFEIDPDQYGEDYKTLKSLVKYLDENH